MPWVGKPQPVSLWGLVLHGTVQQVQCLGGVQRIGLYVACWTISCLQVVQVALMLYILDICCNSGSA